MDVLMKHGAQVDRQQIIRYAGNKSKLLDRIIPIIKRHLHPKQTVLDLFAGTHSVGYALKKRNRIIGNDVQSYSWVIGKGLLEGDYSLSKDSAKRELMALFEDYDEEKYHLFSDLFVNTYFGQKQCNDIDRLKFALDNASIPENKKYAYLCCLMYAMSNTASTTGYFAQYLPLKKTFKLKEKSVLETFLNRCEYFKIVRSIKPNKSLNFDFKKLFNEKKLKKYVQGSDVIYADPPYSAAQYSRYYHILETLVKYDYPELEFKGQYRKDRFISDFCKKTRVSKDFQTLFSMISSFDKKLILSYVNSGNGLMSQKDIIELAKSEFKTVTGPVAIEYKHSKMGNGKPLRVEEFVLICR